MKPESPLSPTEQSGQWDRLESMTSGEIVAAMAECDSQAQLAVASIGQDIADAIDAASEQVKKGGRVFYIGAGTSGRMGVLDASEIPPTFGVSDVFVGLIAGGDGAIRQAVEGAEDDFSGGVLDLKRHGAQEIDVVVGIAASGRTPYVTGALEWAKDQGMLTMGITSNAEGPVALISDMALVPQTGAEFVTGSTRLKAGTAQKLILNQLSTGIMIQCGHVQGNRMVDMQLANAKLVERGARMVAEALHVSMDRARQLLTDAGSVRKAIDTFATRD